MTARYSQRPARFDIEMQAGEDLAPIPIDVTVDDEPFDFTGMTVAAYVYSDSDIRSETKNPTAAATLTIAISGTSQVSVSTTDTVTGVTLGPGLWHWTGEATAAGITRVVVAGKFTLRTKRP